MKALKVLPMYKCIGLVDADLLEVDIKELFVRKYKQYILFQEQK